MKTKTLKYLSVVAFGFILPIPMFADNYVAIAKNGNVYDEANAKYITVNQNNEDVNIIPGMVFKTSEHTPGWYKVEYSPGLHGFIPDQISASDFKSLSPGDFNVSNNPGQKITIQSSGEEWTGIIEGKTYKGIKNDNIIVFVDESGNILFSLVDIGNGPMVMTYDNSVTKFF